LPLLRKPVAAQGEAALQFYAAQGAASLADEVSRIGPQHNFTRLVPDLSAGDDPDDAFSRVPYEKGFYFLYYLQVGHVLALVAPN
jgi:leukotriene-A4 hydrolase